MLNDPRSFSRGFVRGIPAVALALLLSCGLAQAHHHRHYRVSFSRGVSLTDPEKDAALIVDGSSGKVLYARNPDVPRHPASLTKMMTLYLLFDALKQGKVTLATSLTVSPHASVQKPTNLHLSPGDQLTVDTAIRAIVVRSANDVAVAIAEGIGGTESHFAELMTEKARELGMRSTYYHNASGLPDPLQITTASDLANLARHLAYDFPQYFHYFSIPSFTYRGTTYPTHDNLIGRYAGADGIKTGYTGMSGFNLVSSVVRGGEHVIGVVMGGRTAHMRDREMVNLLNWTFGQAAQNPTLIARNQVPWQVAQNTVSPITINAATQPAASPPLVSPTTTVSGPALAFAAPQPNFPGPADDEETAEARTSEGNADLSARAATPNTTAATPVPTTPPAQGPRVASTTAPSPSPTLLPAPKPQTITVVAQLIKPRQKPAEPPGPAASVVVATNQLKPMPKPILSASASDTGEGDIGDEHAPTAPTPGAPSAAAAPANNWIIQIGAYPSPALAQAQLSTYVHKSTDILGKAAQTILPLQSVNGQIVYRARFGPFPEREARDVCNRLSQRGQTCFASAATR